MDTDEKAGGADSGGSSVEMRGDWHAQCLNCGTHVYGHYCANCGQRADTKLHTIGHLLRDTLEDQLSVNSALPRTLRALFLHPGMLTTEYSAGRIVRYIAPFRLYLIASILFFLVLATRTNYQSLVTEIDRETNAITRADSARAAIAAAIDSVAPADTAAADTTAPPDPAAADTTTPPGSAADTAAADSVGRGASVSIGTGRGMRVTSDGLNVNFGIEDTVNAAWWLRPILARMQRQEERLNRLPPAEALALLLAGVERNAPTAVFLMLPFFALILKILYIFKKRYYVEHFVFSLHVHAFGFLLFTLALLIDRAWFTGPALIWLVFYILFAMRRVYAQGWVMTLLKYSFLFFTYVFMLSLVVAAAFLFTAATI